MRNDDCHREDDHTNIDEGPPHPNKEETQGDAFVLDPAEKMIRLLTGKSSNERLRHEKAIKFPVKLMYVLECGDYNDVISWSFDGRSFVIISPKDLEDKVLPEIFKHSKFSSFQRKLYRWGFVKRVKSKLSFYSHNNFQRGNFPLCSRMECAKSRRDSCTQMQMNSFAGFGVLPANTILDMRSSQGVGMCRFDDPVLEANSMTFLPSIPHALCRPASEPLLLSRLAMNNAQKYLDHESQMQSQINLLRMTKNGNGARLAEVLGANQSILLQTQEKQIMQDALTVLHRANQLQSKNLDEQMDMHRRNSH